MTIFGIHVGASSVSPYVMIVTWWTASDIILHHRYIAYELSIYCSSLIYFFVAIAIITTKYQKHYFCYCYLLLPLPLLSYYFATKYFATDIKFPGVVELTTQLLILENGMPLLLCMILMMKLLLCLILLCHLVNILMSNYWTWTQWC